MASSLRSYTSPTTNYMLMIKISDGTGLMPSYHYKDMILIVNLSGMKVSVPIQVSLSFCDYYRF